jgi:hypothetical protein
VAGAGCGAAAGGAGVPLAGGGSFLATGRGALFGIGLEEWITIETTPISMAAKIPAAVIRAARTPSSRVNFLRAPFRFCAGACFCAGTRFFCTGVFFLGVFSTPMRITLRERLDQHPLREWRKCEEELRVRSEVKKASRGAGKSADRQPYYARNRLFPHTRKSRAIFWYISGIPQRNAPVRWRKI